MSTITLLARVVSNVLSTLRQPPTTSALFRNPIVQSTLVAATYEIFDVFTIYGGSPDGVR